MNFWRKQEICTMKIGNIKKVQNIDSSKIYHFRFTSYNNRNYDWERTRTNHDQEYSYYTYGISITI